MAPASTKSSCHHSPVPTKTVEQLQKLETQLAERDAKLTELLMGKAALDAELERLRAEVAEAKRRNTATLDTHNYSEAETRDYFIDLLLKEAGWAPIGSIPEGRTLIISRLSNGQFIDC